MFFMLTFTILSVVITTALWFSTLRPLDQICMIDGVMKRLRISSQTRRPKWSKVKLSNGVETVLPGSIVAKYVMEEVLHFRMRPDDVIIATYIHGGTAWMQEIVWLICHNADFEKANAERLTTQYCFLESAEIAGTDLKKGFQSLEKWPRNKRRFIKTHLPFQLLPYQLQANGVGKMICVARNPKDNLVSLYHFHRMHKGLPEPGTWSEFLTRFCNGDSMLGSWFDYVHKMWQVYQKRQDCMYFVTYENIKKDFKSEVRKLSTFLEKSLSDAEIDAIAEHCSFSSMSNNDNFNYSQFSKTGHMDFELSKFTRKEEVGDWKNYFTINENRAFDEMFAERTKDWSLKFEFESTD